MWLEQSDLNGTVVRNASEAAGCRSFRTFEFYSEKDEKLLDNFKQQNKIL